MDNVAVRHDDKFGSYFNWLRTFLNWAHQHQLDFFGQQMPIPA